MKRILIYSLLLLGQSWGILAQSDSTDIAERDTSAPAQVTINNSDYTNFQIEGDTYVQRYYGDVRMRQDSVYFSADTAIKRDNDFSAWYNVNIQQGDSISIFSDSLYYEGDSLLAYLYRNVALVDRDLQLFNEFLLYDVGQKVATYNSPGLLVKENTQLISKRGQYFAQNDAMYFYDSVRVAHPDFLLKTDSLLFHTQENRVEFLGPTIITFDQQRLYCEAGFYDIDAQYAHLTQRPQLVKDDEVTTADEIFYYGEESQTILIGNAESRDSLRTTKADTIIYNSEYDRTELIGQVDYRDGETSVQGRRLLYFGESGNIIAGQRAQFNLGDGQFLEADSTYRDKASDRSEAIGGVIWRDTMEGLILYSPELESEGEQVLTRGGRPLMIFHSDDGDSIFIAADLIETRADTFSYVSDSVLIQDTARIMRAYRDVRIWSPEFSGRCDSLVYQEKDSLFRMFYDPVIWSDSSQISSDSIFLYMDRGAIRKMDAKENAFMLEQVWPEYFNQVKSINMEAYFEEGKIQTLWAISNAEMYYYILDEDEAFMGLQKSSSSRIQALFDSTSNIDQIKWITQIEGEIIPMKQVKPLEYRYDGFRWRWTEKPKSQSDLDSDDSLRPYISGLVPVTEKWDSDEIEQQKKAMQILLHYLFPYLEFR